MTWNELKRALDDALSLGKVGTPVSLRLYLTASESAESWTSWGAAGANLGEELFGSAISWLVVSGAPDERQHSVLAEYGGGETTMITVTQDADSVGGVDLVLFGNHGTIRLEGGEAFEGPPGGEIPPDLESGVLDAAHTGVPVGFGA